MHNQIKGFTVLCTRNRQCEQIGTLSSLPLIVESRYPSILKTIPKVRLIISCLLRKRKKKLYLLIIPYDVIISQ